MNDLLNIPCPLANSTSECTSLSIIVCPVAYLLQPGLCCLYKAVAWHGQLLWQASGAKSCMKRGLLPCDCEPVLKAEGWTLGIPAYSLRSTSCSRLLLSFLCHVLPACLFPLPSSLSFFPPCPLAHYHFMFMVV